MSEYIDSVTFDVGAYGSGALNPNTHVDTDNAWYMGAGDGGVQLNAFTALGWGGRDFSMNFYLEAVRSPPVGGIPVITLKINGITKATGQTVRLYNQEYLGVNTVEINVDDVSITEQLFIFYFKVDHINIGYGHDFMGVPAANIGNVMGVPAANIDKIIGV